MSKIGRKSHLSDKISVLSYLLEYQDSKAAIKYRNLLPILDFPIVLGNRNVSNRKCNVSHSIKSGFVNLDAKIWYDVAFLSNRYHFGACLGFNIRV